MVVINTEGAGEFGFDGESWLLLGRSSAHNSGFVVYDEARNVPVLVHYNGRISEWAPTGWRVLYYPHWSLNLTVVAASYFDGSVVMYAGHDRRNESLPMISVLGSWDGTIFHTYRIDSPPFRMAPNVVLDKHRNRLIMYGGLGREGGAQQSYSDQTARTETWALKVVK
jgi:hypothetical protein